jgi:hypothetical protein
MMISILLSVLDLLPLPVGSGLFTDGFRIATLLRDRERTRRLLSICAIGAQRQKGKPPKKWKQTWLKAASSVRDDSVDDFQGNWLAYISCIARNEGGSGAVHLERCLQMTNSLKDAVRDLTALESAIFSARFRRDAPLAEKWLKQIVGPKLMQPLTKNRLDIAMRFARTDFEAALKARRWNSGTDASPCLRENSDFFKSTRRVQ